MYDGTIFVGGSIGSYGSDAVDAELTKSDQDWLKRKLRVAEISYSGVAPVSQALI